MDGVTALLREDVFENFETILPADPPASAPPGFSPGAPPGILFVEDFDQKPAPPEPPPTPEPEIIEPVFCQDDVEAAHAAGRELGLAAARTEHSAVQAQLSAAALAAIGDALAAARAQAAAAAQRVAEDLAAAMLAMLQAALPAASEALAGGEVRALLRTLLPALNREPALQIRLHPDLLGDVSESIRQGLPHYAGSLTISGDGALAKGDVSIMWHDGEARRDCAALWAGIRQDLAPYELPAIEVFLKGAGHGE